MRLLLLNALLPLALAAPAGKPIPELSTQQWNSIQSSFSDGLRSLSQWSWGAAEGLVAEIEGIKHQDDDETQKTIWQQLKEDTNSFSRLVKVIEFEGESAKYLDDKDLQITFFAPNNDALTPPKHGHHDHDELIEELSKNPSLDLLSAALESDASLLKDDDDDDDDDEKKKRCKEIFKKIAGKVLQYHGLAKAYTAQELAQNSTVATVLKADDGSYGGLHRRIRIEKSLLPPSLKINFYSRVLVSDKKARNGYFHTLNHPLIPPPSIFEELFLFPDEFSTFTSAVQGVHGRKYIDWHYDHEASKDGDPQFYGTALTTVFAPNNKAFLALPFKLKLYLFSPFGRHALVKVLAYHAVPDTLLLSELLYKEKAKEELWGGSGSDPSFHKEFIVNSALPNATLKVEVDKTQLLPIEGVVKTTIKVNDQLVEVIDVPARNGATHVIGKLLVPPHKHHDDDGNDVSGEDDWENWEDWVPSWADEV